MPRVFRKGLPVVSLCTLTGSAIPHASLSGLLSAVVTFCVSYFVPRSYLEELFAHPYPLQPFAAWLA